MRAKNVKSVIPFADYCRIHRVISSVLTAAGAQAEGACKFFAIAGSAILRRHYKLEAMPVAGAAAYAIGFGQDQDVVATFGMLQHDYFFATPEQFHCWIQCNGIVVDFMAPIFEENLRSSGIDAVVPRRVFQKPLTAMSPTLPHQFREGAFHLVPSQELTKEVHDDFRRENLQQDLANICLQWFRRPPKPMDEVFGMVDEKGRLTTLKLQPIDITGYW